MTSRQQTVAPSQPATSTTAQPVFPDLITLKRSLPPFVFERELSNSLYYVAREVVIIASLVGMLYGVRNNPVFPAWFQLAVTVLYVLLQSMIFWGVFVLGHDCGHGSFSNHSWVNQLFGNLLHSFILTPYEPWKLSHCHHHKNTGNMDKDEIFYPIRGEGKTDAEIAHWAGFRAKLFTLGFAWAAYIVVGYPPRSVPHLSTVPAIFQGRRKHVLISLACWTAMVCLLAVGVFKFGFAAVGVYYLLPLFGFATWLVVVTFLHHNDENAPWYGDDTWDYVKGNLSSVDRSYGKVVDNLIHDIGTHQVHHLFPIIPHYKLVQAATAFKKAWPHLVRESHKSIYRAFYDAGLDFVAYGMVPDKRQFFTYAERKKEVQNGKAKATSKSQ